jgi:EmrB/QacA subfamily drug resistance transporter
MNTYHQKLKVKLLPFLVAVAFFMEMLDASILNTAIPVIAKSFGDNPVRLDITITAYIFSVIVLLPVSGWLADKFSVRRVFFLSIAIFTVGSFLCSISENLVQLTLSRTIQGLGGAMIMPVGRLAVLKATPRKKYLNVISFVIMPALLGPLLGPAVGGFICQYFSWHWIFLINIPIGIICCAAAFYLMPYIRPSLKKKFDVWGFVIFDLAAISFFMVGSDMLFIKISNGAFFLIGTCLVLIYILYARRKGEAALFDMEMFKTHNFSVCTAGNLIVRLAAGALPFLAPLFLQEGLGFSPSKAGSALIPLACGAIFAKVIVVRLLKYLGYRRLMVINTLTLSAFVACLIFVNHSTPFWVMLTIFAFIGLANSVQFSTINTLSLLDVPNKFLSGANSLISVVVEVSLAFGVSFSAILLEHFIKIHPGQSMVAQFHDVYFVVAAFTAVNSLIFLLVHQPKDQLF